MEAEKPKAKKKQLAQAIQNFEAENDGDLTLAVGDTVVLTKAKEGQAWWKGYIQGNKKAKGVFPASYVQVLDQEPASASPPPSGEYCVAIRFLTCKLELYLLIAAKLS